jgi:hypothetical protein
MQITLRADTDGITARAGIHRSPATHGEFVGSVAAAPNLHVADFRSSDAAATGTLTQSEGAT